MDPSMAVIGSGSRQQRVSDYDTRRIITPQFDVSYSLGSNTGLGYGWPYACTSLNYNFPQFTAPSWDGFAGNGIQPVSLATSLTVIHSVPHFRDTRTTIAMADERSSVKAESNFPRQVAEMLHARPPAITALRPSHDTSFITDVDTLMRTIQTKAKPKSKSLQETASQFSMKQTSMSYTSPDESITDMPSEDPGQTVARNRNKYQCDIASCAKGFFQKTHLDIHMRAHTGYKPFLCQEPSCGQRFSQFGNLKTHERRHTGERPFSCDACGKRFAQRGNVRAHRIVHEQIKPFSCKLENCGKQFTQLGNLKSHQNKFHTDTLRNLTIQFASMGEGDTVSPQDKELWDYFSILYKNSNKGIKGRGKDRRISTILNTPRSPEQNNRSRCSSRNSGSGSGSSDVSISDQQEMYEIDFRERDRMSSDGGLYKDEQMYDILDSKMS